MSTVVLRSEDALKSRFHANAFGYRPQPPMNPHRRKPPPPARPAADAAAAPPSPPSHKPSRAAPARTGRKPRPAAGVGKENDGGPADELRHHRRRLVMEEVTILKRGEAMKPSAPVPPGSNVGDVTIDLNRRKLGFPAVDPVFAGPGYSVSSPRRAPSPTPASC
uniref:Uncharacterized protein n=1 Tax=Ananas comosus var. bracteatus TaxID=296719 RepID=A0A6V7P4C2_ANACO|nr:unnamed protein product [Ananas comosus var. bracteatus]